MWGVFVVMDLRHALLSLSIPSSAVDHTEKWWRTMKEDIREFLAITVPQGRRDYYSLPRFQFIRSGRGIEEESGWACAIVIVYILLCRSGRAETRSFVIN